MDKLDNTTFKKDVKTDPKNRIEVEIGDSKQPDFKPQFKLMRWDNEVNFSMRAEEKQGATMEDVGGVIKYITTDYEVHQYEKPNAGEDGGFEFEWVLNKKPDTNVLTATIQTKGLDFFYQPPLTQEEIDAKHSRPDNIVGSYAVYHSSRNGTSRSGELEYKTGKFCHIYRPKAIDANNNEVWCELDISSVLTVTVPQDFLDNASYPVKVDPTFGYTSSGASTEELENTSDTYFGAFATLFNLPEEATTVDSLSGYFGVTTGRIGGAKLMVYSNNAGVPNARQGYTNEGTYTDATSELVTQAPVAGFGLAAGDWWIAVTGVVTNASGAGQVAFVRYDAGGTDSSRDSIFNYATPDATWTEFSSNTRKYSIYVTYTSTPAVAPSWSIALV